MRFLMSPRLPTPALLLCCLPLLGCPGAEEAETPTPSPTSPPGGTPTPEVGPTATPADTPTETPRVTPTPEATTPPEEETPVEPGKGARAFKITTEDELLRGPAAQGRSGDFKLANDQIQVVIQAPGRDIGWGMFGGTILDAALVGPDGQPGMDSFGEMSVLFNLSSSMATTSVTVEDDGYASGTARIVAEGEDDLFDVLKVDAALDDFSSLLTYDINADFPLRLRTTYSLGPHDRYVEVITEFINESGEAIYTPAGDLVDAGGDLENFVPNPELNDYSINLQGEEITYTWGGFGEAEYAEVDLLAWAGSDVTYGYVPPLTSTGDPNAMSVSVSGVTVSVLGTTSLLDVLRGSKRELLEIPANGTARLERFFVVGKDVGSVTDEAYAIRRQTTGVLQGQVVEAGSNKPLPYVRLGILKDGTPGASVTALLTDGSGHFSCQLPPGNYGLQAVQGLDFSEDGRPGLLTPQTFSVKAGQTTSQSVALPATGQLRLKVLDGNLGDGSTLPSRVTLFGDYARPPAAVMDITDDHLQAGVARVLWLTEGEGTFDVKPGTYKAVFSRGFEYDIHTVNDVVISANQVTDLTGTLTRVLDTTGYLAADLHVHGINSPDSPVTQERRVRTFVTEAVEVLVATDHDFVTDYQPTIDAMGLENVLTSISGVECTTFNLGHFNVFPLLASNRNRAGGALDWADLDYLPDDLQTGEPVDVGAASGLPSARDNLSLSQIFEAYEKSTAGTQVHQVNHGRDYLMGYFRQIGLNLDKLDSAVEYTAKPADFRIADGTDLLEPELITAIEVQNGTSMAKATEVMNDWFGFLNLGYRMAGTASSDTHYESSNPGGYGRTFVPVPEEDLEVVNLDPDFKQAFADGVNALGASGGNGLFVTAEVLNNDGESAGMGELITADSGQATLRVRVQAPSWTSFQMVEIFANPVVYANADNSLELTSPTDLNPQETLLAGSDFEPTEVEVPTSREGGAYRLEAVIDVPFELTEDTWLLAVARGSAGGLSPLFDSGEPPLAFTNPIFVDADGDGVFTAPGQAFVVPYVAPNKVEAKASRPATSTLVGAGRPSTDPTHRHQNQALLDSARAIAEERHIQGRRR